MNRFSLFLRRVLDRPYSPVNPGPQINPGPGKVKDGDGPQINPGPGAVKPNPYDQPQINGGPGDGFFSRSPVLGLGRRVERPYSSRPFGAAQDDTLF